MILGLDATGPTRVEATGTPPRGGFYDAIITFNFENHYPTGMKMVGDNSAPRGLTLEGTEGKLFVAVHGCGLSAEPPSLLQGVKLPGVDPYAVHRRGLLDGVRGGRPVDFPSPASDPVYAVRLLDHAPQDAGTTLLALPNFHHYLSSVEVVQGVARHVEEGRRRLTFVVVLAPLVQLPPELERLFAVLKQALPDRGQLAEIARGVANQPGELPEGPDFERLLDAASGLSRYEAEGAFALSLVRQQRLTPETRRSAEACTTSAAWRHRQRCRLAHSPSVGRSAGRGRRAAPTRVRRWPGTAR
ncbi:hypothetical protein Pla175_29410 [Pirellulimonas nuda]|uniref:Uncharacterized protein n=1 Tax=Pirellulimonas nuda TaxID=2528009 RepID=A0A518DDJ5_9BACT|nr:hypothetical protein Pla175_29410 [Pirellulimonas nuda]